MTQVAGSSRESLLLSLTDLLQDGEPEDALQSISEKIGKHFQCSRVGFRDIDEMNGTFDVRACWTDGTVPPLLGRHSTRAFGPKIVADLGRGKTVIVEDLLSDPISDDGQTRDNARKFDTRSILVVPFVWSGTLRSMIFINDKTPRKWTSEEIELAEEVAARTRRIIQLAEATRQRREALKRLEFLDLLHRQVAALYDADAILKVTTRITGEHMGVSAVAYSDMDPDGASFTVRGDWSANGSASIAGRYSLAAFGSATAETLRAGNPLVINDVEEIGPEDANSFRSLGIIATVCMPLVKNGVFKAAMAFHHNAPHVWTDAELRLIREITERSWAHVERVRAEAELRESEVRLELATAAAEIGIWDWNLETNTFTYSPRARLISGFPLDAPVTFEMVRDVVHPEDYPTTSKQAERALDPALRERIPFEYRIVHPDGSIRWVVAHGGAVFRGEGSEARAVRYVGTLQDVTATKQLQEAEREASRRLKVAVDAGRMAVWEIDLRTGAITASKELNAILGFPEGATPSPEEIRARYYPGERERIEKLGAEALSKGERFVEAEYRYTWADGTVRWLLQRCEVKFEGPMPVKAVGVVTDVTERKSVEQDREVLVAELSHRVKNTLATVSSIERQSFKAGASVEDARQSFQRRIQALAQTHTRLSEENWSGVSLRTLLEDELSPYEQDNIKNIVLSGPSIVLNTKASLTLGMAIHELATNAAKYGSLSAAGGRLQVTWRNDGSSLHLEWRETAGPKVLPPTRKGFGSLLLERGISIDLRGEVRLVFSEDGLTCSMILPLTSTRVESRQDAA